MTNEVVDLLQALRDGAISLEDLAQRFRERTWPPTMPAPPASYLELAERALEDPRPDVPGSFDDVVAAYDRGELTRDQYRVLADAAADSIRAAEHRDA